MNTVFANEPKKGIMVVVAVSRLANMWFQDSSWDNVHVRYELTNKGRKEDAGFSAKKRKQSRRILANECYMTKRL